MKRNLITFLTIALLTLTGCNGGSSSDPTPAAQPTATYDATGTWVMACTSFEVLPFPDETPSDDLLDTADAILEVVTPAHAFSLEQDGIDFQYSETWDGLTFYGAVHDNVYTGNTQVLDPTSIVKSLLSDDPLTQDSEDEEEETTSTSTERWLDSYLTITLNSANDGYAKMTVSYKSKIRIAYYFDVYRQ